MKKIADTGLLVAAADSHDRHHRWAATALRKQAPFHTCEAVILETAWVLGSPVGVLTLIARGDLVLDPAFDFSAEISRLLELCRKYADRSMDLVSQGRQKDAKRQSPALRHAARSVRARRLAGRTACRRARNMLMQSERAAL